MPHHSDQAPIGTNRINKKLWFHFSYTEVFTKSLIHGACWQSELSSHEAMLIISDIGYEIKYGYSASSHLMV
jgi:hypothetical protein